MKAAALVAVLLLLAGCGSTVTNTMTFDRDFQDSNPAGNSTPPAALTGEEIDAVLKRLPSEKAMESYAPEEREKVIDKAIADAKKAGEIAERDVEGPSEVGSVSTPMTTSGYGYQINIFSQAGTTAQDIAAQVDAVLRARAAMNSPNADISGDDVPKDGP